MKKKVYLPLFLFLASWLMGFQTYDRRVTSFEPIKTEEGYAYYKYTSFADTIYPIDSEEAEKIRINWLEKWLSDNGYSDTNYEIVSRMAMLRNKGLIGSGIYDIFYEVKVKERTP